MRINIKQKYSKLLLKTKKDNKEKPKEQIKLIYNSIKPFEIKNNTIYLNNSNVNEVLNLFNELKQEQFKY